MPSAPWSIFRWPASVHTAAHDEAWRKVCGDFSMQQDQPWIRDCRPIAGFEYHRAAAVQWLEGLGVKATLDTVLITNGTAHAMFPRSPRW